MIVKKSGDNIGRYDVLTAGHTGEISTLLKAARAKSEEFLPV